MAVRSWFGKSRISVYTTAATKMLGLGVYQSSSEDETEQQVNTPKLKTGKQQPLQIVETPETKAPKTINAGSSATSNIEPSGPVLGPLHAQGPQTLSDERPHHGQFSPFSANQALIQDLTLPPVPDLDIPLSPPGSPSPSANAKFAHFLSLKKQGIHFNEKLAGSESLKNPSLLRKLMEHAGIDYRAQYHTSLPADVWDTSNLPIWGFKEELLKAQQEIRQKTDEKRLAGQRDSIDFVAGKPT